MEYYQLPLYIIFGILPSLIWLFYYLLKDLHPEPKRMILKVFLYGVAATLPVFLAQVLLTEFLKQLQPLEFMNSFPIVMEIIKWFFIIALTEEVAKYFIVKSTIFNSYALDEPLDVMLYMVVAALGFAALENILYLFSPFYDAPLSTVVGITITISFIRFIGATFLHTLCSALLGYFVVKSFFDAKKRLKFTVIGISLAVLLHGLYDFSIITLQSPFNLIVPVIIIAGLASFMVYDFDEVKKLKGICKI